MDGIAGILAGLIDGHATYAASYAGGVLTMDWNGEQLRMTGPAESVFTGQVDIDKLVFSMALNR